MMNMTLVLYILCEVISLLFMHFATKKSHNRKLYFILSFLPFAILFILRGVEVGTDFKSYINAYLSLINGSLNIYDEQWLSVGFRIILQFMGYFFSKNYLIVYAIINLTTLLLVYITIYKYSENPTLSLFIYFSFCLHFQIFNQFRQMFALSITFYAFKYIKKKQMWKYIIAIIVAGTIHTSSLIMLPFYFINNTKFTKKKVLIYLIIALAGFIFFDLIKEIISLTPYDKYLGGKFDTVELSSIINLFVRIVMFVLVILFYKVIKEKNPRNDTIDFLCNNVLICTVLQLLVIRSYILARLTTYFYVYYILLIPIIYNYFMSKVEKKHIWKIIFILVMIAYQLVYYFSSSGAVRAGYDVYSTFF